MYTLFTCTHEHTYIDRENISFSLYSYNKLILNTKKIQVRRLNIDAFIEGTS